MHINIYYRFWIRPPGKTNALGFHRLVPAPRPLHQQPLAQVSWADHACGPPELLQPKARTELFLTVMHIPKMNASKFHLEREGWQVIAQPLTNIRFTKLKPQKNLSTFALCCQILVMFYFMYFSCCCLVLVFLDHKFSEAGFMYPMLFYVFYNMKFITYIYIYICIYVVEIYLWCLKPGFCSG